MVSQMTTGNHILRAGLATLAVASAGAFVGQAHAVPPDMASSGAIGRTQEAQVLYGSAAQGGRSNAGPTTQPTVIQSNRLDATDLLVAQLWGLSVDEMVRAKALMQGPRAAFSVPNLSPVEALGIHARSDAERRKYAEMFARALHDDVKRSLAWNVSYEEARKRLYGYEPVVDFSHVPKVAVPVGAADAANVPRSVVIDVAPSASGNKGAAGAGR